MASRGGCCQEEARHATEEEGRRDVPLLSLMGKNTLLLGSSTNRGEN